MLVGLLPGGIASVNAATSENITYTTSAYYGYSTVTGYSGLCSGTLEIPSELDGYPVRKIANNAFKDMNYLTGVIIPEGVTSIGSYAFSGTGLKSIVLPDSLSSISSYAFYQSPLKKVHFGCGISTIGDSAFKDCTALSKVHICDIKSWCEVYFGGSNSSYANPLYYAKNLYLNNELITDLVIPEGVTAIKNDVFRNCKGITSISFPSTLTSIGGNTFEGCSSITKTNISDIASWCNVDFMFASSNPTYLSKNIFLNDEAIVDLEIPAEVTEIKPYAFYNCDTIETVTVLGSLEKIGEEAFYGCDNLATLDLGETAGDIASTAFTGTKVYSESDWDNGVLYFNNVLVEAKTSLQGDYVVKDGTTAISRSAFMNCTSLTSISMPDTVKIIGDEAFYGCTSLKTVDLSENLEKLGAKAFYNCSQLSTIDIPNRVRKINDYAFYQCRGLNTVSLGENVESIGNSAFASCFNLSNINLPESLMTIGNSAFSTCTNLDIDINIPNVVSIGTYAFLNCENTNDLTLSSQLSSISIGAFKGVGRIDKLLIPDSVKYIGSEAFYGSNITEVIFGTGIEQIGADAFKECTLVEKMTIKDIGKWCEIEFLNVYSNLMYLEKPVYIGNMKLTGNLIINEGIEYINSYAFMYCDEFSSLTLSDTVKEIKTDAFTSCSSLKKIILGENVTSISSKAFYNCGNISTIALNEKLSSIGSEAFYMSIIMNVWYEGEDKSDITINSTNANAFNYATWHNNIDIINGHVYQYACSAKCEICSAIRSVDNHSYDNECDTTCNVCGNQRIATHFYKDEHDHTCEQCRYSKTPGAPVVETYTDTMVTLVPNDQFEYSMDGEVWQDENVFLNLSPYTQYYFYQRVKATEDNDCSEASARKYMRTNKSNQDKPSEAIVLNTSKNQIVLAYISGYEYSIDGCTWQESNLFDNLEMNKQYTVYQRVAEDETHYASPKSDGVQVWTDTHSGDVNRDNVIDNLDRLVIARYLADWDDYSADSISMKAADVNQDGFVDNLDRLVLARYLADWEGYKALPCAR